MGLGYVADVIDEGVGGISLFCACPAGIGLTKVGWVAAASLPVTDAVTIGAIGIHNNRLTGPFTNTGWKAATGLVFLLQPTLHTRRASISRPPPPISSSGRFDAYPHPRRLKTSLASKLASIPAAESNTEGTHCSIGEVVAGH